MSNVNKILITSDLARVTDDLKSFHDIRIDKYYRLLSWQIEKVTDLPVESFKSTNVKWDTKEYYNLFDVELNSKFDWVKVYNVRDIPTQVIDYYKNIINNSLVIYIEASETQKRIHNILNIPYIDLTVHPIRYLDDNIFGMASNSSKIRKIFDKYKIDVCEFELGAHLVAAQAAQSNLNIRENSVLFVGQTELDKSLIDGNKLLEFSCFKEKIKKEISNYDCIYFKPHPYRKNNDEIRSALEEFGEVIVINDNIYKILSNRNIRSVIGISSSAVYEARFFNKKRCFLRKSFRFDYEGRDDNNNLFYSIGDPILYPKFWFDILNSINVNAVVDDYQIKHIPNRIRAALNDYWSQTEMDPSVRIVSKYLEPKFKVIDNKTDQVRRTKVNLKTNKQKIAYSCIKLFERIPYGNNIIDAIIFKALNEFLIKRSKKQSEPRIVHCLTYRPEAPKGGRGGAGAVVSAMKKILGRSCGKYPVKYTFSEKDGVWHSEKNKYFNENRFPIVYSNKTELSILWSAMIFALDNAKNNEEVYVTHEIGTAYGLSLLNKKYILVIHSQGPRLEEKIKLGDKVSYVGRKIINYVESVALKKAIKVYFPSNGAKDSFFSSKYCNVHENDVNIGGSLYNTLYYHEQPRPFDLGVDVEGKIILLSVGTCTEAKGFDNTIVYIKQLSKKTEKDIVWLWVGKGPLEEKVRRIADSVCQECQNFKYVHYRKLSYANVQYLMKLADIYVMLHRKSIFDLATLEAMYSECALILSPIEGNLEFNKCNNVLYSDSKNSIDVGEIDIDYYKKINRVAYDQYFSNENFYNEYMNSIKELLEVN